MARRRILVVDDEENMRLAVKEALLRRDYDVSDASGGREALAAIAAGPFDLVVSDVKMPGMDGMTLLREVKRLSPSTAMVLITAFGTIEHAVEAVKEGATDFILKPFSLEALEATVEKALRDDATAGEFESRGKSMLAVDPLMRRIISLSLTAAACDATVLISGESGTGKELLARFIHSKGPRAEGPFVAVNCASIPDGLLESELFGYEKGAFTGAAQQRRGKFELASGGTLLLDEISEMEMKLQAKLLRVIQEKEVERLGARTPIPLDIRIIATTNRDMKKEVAEGRFREDLFYRLNIFPLTLPPLRERRDDIMPLAGHFLSKFSSKYGKRLERVSDEAVEYLKGGQWRGNIRELENAMERAVLVSQGTTLEMEHLVDPAQREACASIAVAAAVTHARATVSEATVIAGPARMPVTPLTGPDHAPAGVNQTDKKMTLREMEMGMIYKTLDDVSGNRTQAARILGISVRTLRNKLKEYGQILPG